MPKTVIIDQTPQTFDDLECDIIRYLRNRLTANPTQTAKEFPKSEEIMNKFKMEPPTYYRVMGRFESLNLLEIIARGATGEFARIHDKIYDVDRQLELFKPELPDYWATVTKWFRSKPWSVAFLIAGVGIPWVIGILASIKKLVEVLTR